MIVEAILAKNLGWRIEFLTGGYKIYPIEELVEISKLISKVYGEKIWLNLGALPKNELEMFRPYVKGVVASIETVNEELHNQICPDKHIADYEKMLSEAEGFKKSITIVIGLGEKKEDFEKLKDMISKYGLDRITFYALKPVPGTPYTDGPSTEDYVWWISKTRESFPDLEIIAGTTLRRVNEVSQVLMAGANAITKFPATKKFNSEEAQILEKEIAKAGREFVSTLTKLPDINWEAEVDRLDIDNKEEVKKKLFLYLEKMKGVVEG